MISENLKEKLRKNLSESQYFTEIFSSQQIYNFQKILLSGWTKTRSYMGGKILFDNFTKECKEYFLGVFKEISPHSIIGTNVPWDTVSLGGNVYITPTEYGLHTDAFTQGHIDQGEVTLKNITIPLSVAGNNIDNPSINNLMVFENRLLDTDHTFQKGKQASEAWKVQYQQNLLDYSDLEFYDRNGNVLQVDVNKQYITDQEYAQHFTHINRTILDGFKIEKTCHYDVGSMIVHDSTQAHATGHMHQGESFVANKMGVRFSLKARINSL
jgi:hypothetical protein